MKERDFMIIKTYIEPTIKVVDMSCEGMLCVSGVFMLNSYDDGGDVDLDFTLSF